MEITNEEFLELLHQTMKNDPPVFISGYALLHIMHEKTPDALITTYYPRSDFEEAIRMNESAVASNEKEPSKYIDRSRAVAELIRTYWLDKAVSAA